MLLEMLDMRFIRQLSSRRLCGMTYTFYTAVQNTLTKLL